MKLFNNEDWYFFADPQLVRDQGKGYAWGSDLNYIERSKKQQFPQEMLTSIINSVPSNGRFVDVGCGTGVFLKAISERAKEMKRPDIQFYGMDVTPEMINQAREVNKGNDVALAVGGDASSKESLQKAMAKLGVENFDFLNFAQVLFFFDDQQKPLVLQNLKSILFGEEARIRVVVREPNNELPKTPFFKDITPDQLKSLMLAAGFGNVDVEVGRLVQYANAKYNQVVATATNLEHQHDVSKVTAKPLESTTKEIS